MKILQHLTSDEKKEIGKLSSIIGFLLLIIIGNSLYLNNVGALGLDATIISILFFSTVASYTIRKHIESFN